MLATWRDGESVIVVVAKAGTGKTRTAAALACLALAENQDVLLTSFTKNGVKELARELAREHGLFLERVTESLWEGPGIFLRTFDSMLAWSLRQIGVEGARWGRVGLRWQVTNLASIGGEPLLQAGLDAGLWSLRSYDYRLRDICDLVARRQPLSAEVKRVLGPSWRALREKAKSEKLILPGDYDSLVISHAGDIAELIEKSFSLVVVDEAQDSSKRDVSPLAQAALGGRLAQVHFGDPGQAVMGFRGALGDPCEAFRSAGLYPEILALTRNYRLSPEIVLASNSLQRAAGFKGPLAIAHPASPRGPAALLALMQDDTTALDALMVVLAVTGLAAPDPASKRRLPTELASALEVRGKQLLHLCGERTPLVEVICPTNALAEALVGALEEREVEPAWVRSVANPYDSILATLLIAWFDQGGHAIEQARMILTAHVNAWAYKAPLATRKELSACGDVVLKGLTQLPRDANRLAIAKIISTCLSTIAAHPKLGEEGRHYAESARLLVNCFARVPNSRSVDEALAVLEQTLAVRRRPRQVRRKKGQGPSMLQALTSAGLRPEDVPAWLDEQARRWHLGALEEPTSGVVVKTPEVAKGDTCDAVIVHHAESLPRPKRHSFLAAEKDDELSQPAQAYIAVSRPRFVYIGLAVGSLPSYHDVPLAGWSYFDAREEARGRDRPA